MAGGVILFTEIVKKYSEHQIILPKPQNFADGNSKKDTSR